MAPPQEGCHGRQGGCTPRTVPPEEAVTRRQVHGNREYTPEQCHRRRVSPPGRCMAIEGEPGGQCHRRTMALVADAAPKGRHPRQVRGNSECTPRTVSPGEGVTPGRCIAIENTPSNSVSWGGCHPGRCMAIANVPLTSVTRRGCHTRQVHGNREYSPEQCHPGRMSPPAGAWQ